MILKVPQDYPTIQEAIEAAPAGSTIVVAPGTYRENLTIYKSLTLKGFEARLQAKESQPAVRFQNADEVSMEDFLIRPQEDPPGRGIPLHPPSEPSMGILITGDTRAFLKWNYLQDWTIGVQVESGASALLVENSIWTNAVNAKGLVIQEAEATLQTNRLYIESSLEFVEGIYAYKSHLRAIENQIFILLGAREVASALFLVDSEAEVLRNIFVAQRSNGVTIQGAGHLTIDGNYISTDSVGVSLLGSQYFGSNGCAVMIRANYLYGLPGAGAGFSIQNFQAVDIAENMINGYRVGVFWGSEGRGLMKRNLIVGNHEDGVLIERSAFRVLLEENRILSNEGCGVRIADALQNNLEAIEGEGNWIEGNQQGDLCPLDFPWPAGFIKKP